MNTFFNKGFSLVELMVGMTVGLLGMVVILQVFSVNEASKRTTTSGSDAQLSGALGLHTIERDARMAGYGINLMGFLGCTIRAYNEDRQPPSSQDFTFSFVPVQITQGVGTAPDTITITYSNASSVTSPASITQNMPSPSAVYKVNNRYGFNVNDLVIAAEAGKDCTLAQVSNVPGSPGQSDNVIHNSGNGMPYNKPSGLGVSYTTSAKLYNIGPIPVSNVYSIQSNNLQVFSNFSGVNEQVASNVVDLQAQYGIDTSTPVDNVVDVYQNSPDQDADGVVSAAEWARVLSIRFGLVARSINREASCNVTSAAPTWQGGTFSNVSTLPGWNCYRYRVFETTTMIRNMLWKPN